MEQEALVRMHGEALEDDYNKRSPAWARTDLEATAKVSYAPSKSISRAALNLFSLP